MELGRFCPGYLYPSRIKVPKGLMLEGLPFSLADFYGDVRSFSKIDDSIEILLRQLRKEEIPPRSYDKRLEPLIVLDVSQVEGGPSFPGKKRLNPCQ